MLTRRQPESTRETLRKFTTLITSPQQPRPNVTSHTLRLSAIIVAPGPTLPPRSIASMSPSSWSDTLNTRLLAPFTTLHAFLPLAISQKSSVLFLTPSVIPSLTLPSHAAESVVAGGLQNYVSTLRKEVQDQDVNVVQFRLGQFDYGLFVEDDQQQLMLSQHLIAAEAAKQRLDEKAHSKSPAKGTSLRQLHNDVFDAVVRGKGKNGTIFVGRGSRAYDLVGNWVPDGIVGWMIGAVKAANPEHIVEDLEYDGKSERSWDNVGERECGEQA